MTNKQKRNKVATEVKNREGKNSYTQGLQRTLWDRGFSDCSSLVQGAYATVGVAIGSYTGAQIDRGELIQGTGTMPNEAVMLPGDLIFFGGPSSNGRRRNVNHVEVYVGNGQLSGHGSGIGPTRKNMASYIKQKNAAGQKFLEVRRYIKQDASDGATTPGAPAPSAPATGDKYTVKKGDSLSAIAKKYGVTVNDLVAWNNIVNRNLINAGQVIVVKKPSATAPSVPTPSTPTQGRFNVKISITTLNIRTGPGTSYKAMDKKCPVGVYTITETKTANGFTWGKLLSGVGWIALEYAKKL